MPWRHRSYTTSDIGSAILPPYLPLADPYLSCATQQTAPEVPEQVDGGLDMTWDLSVPQQHWLPMMHMSGATPQDTGSLSACYPPLVDHGLDAYRHNPPLPQSPTQPECLSTGFQVPFCESPTSPKKRPHSSHTRKRSPGYIKRPCNAFILFRSHAVANQLIPKEVEKDHRNISRIISYMWRSLSPEERRLWDIAAEEERERHRQLHPDYKYRPSTRRTNVQRRNVRRSSGTARQCESIANAILKACGREGVKSSGSTLPPSTSTLTQVNTCAQGLDGDNDGQMASPHMFVRRSSSAPPITPHQLNIVPQLSTDASPNVKLLLSPPRRLSTMGLDPSVLGSPLQLGAPGMRVPELSPTPDAAVTADTQDTPYMRSTDKSLFDPLPLSPDNLLQHDGRSTLRTPINNYAMEFFSLGQSFPEENVQATHKLQLPLPVAASKSAVTLETQPAPAQVHMPEPKTTQVAERSPEAAEGGDNITELWSQLLSSLTERPASLDILKNEPFTPDINQATTFAAPNVTPLGWNCTQRLSTEMNTLVSPTTQVP